MIKALKFVTKMSGVWGVFVLTLSCSKEPAPECKNILPQRFDDVMVSTSDLTLFAKLDRYLLPGPHRATRSTGSEPDSLVCLESLLERDSSKSVIHGKWIVTQTPFKKPGKEVYVRLSSFCEPAFVQDSLSFIRKFLIEMHDTEAGTVSRRIATMIPDAECCRLFGESGVSFIDKSVFTGIILFSGTDGSFKDVYVYGDGPISDGELTTRTEPDSLERFTFLCLPSAGTATRGDGSIVLNASYCIAEKPKSRRRPMLWEQMKEELPYALPGGGGGGGGSSAGHGTGGTPKKPSQLPEDPLTFNVNLYAAEGGSVEGSGQYPEGKYVTCVAVPDGTPPLLPFRFDRWTGALRSRPSKWSVLVERDIEATAYFKHHFDTTKRPCWSAWTDIANPLTTMDLAPTSTWTREYKGSTYGKTRWNRDGSLKFHNGIDLRADVGTPVYAMYDGVISSSKPYVTEQPDRRLKEWPVDYKGDTDGGGNRFYMDCIIGGKTVTFGFWHLQAGTPVATNPRTGKPFDRGDRVYQGEIIGYTGRTGNAWDVPYPHLHLAAYDSKGARTNPEQYLNGDVVKAGGGVSRKMDNRNASIRSTAFSGIHCDEEPQIGENPFNLSNPFKK